MCYYNKQSTLVETIMFGERTVLSRGLRCIEGWRKIRDFFGWLAHGGPVGVG